MPYKRKITCDFCDDFFYEISDYVSHMEKHHYDAIPNDMTPWQFVYFLKTKKNHGNCVMCKRPTTWNEKTHKYNRFCERQKCHDDYINIFKNRMIGKYGKTTLLNDPEQQKIMLANRSISNVYRWSDHVHSTPYTGSYELSFLEFLDNNFFDPEDVIGPSPHTYFYLYENKRHFYIPDFFIPSLELEIEIKDGGDNPNMHHKIQDVDKVKEKLKDEVMLSIDSFNYIKIVNKENEKLYSYLIKAKDDFVNGVTKKIKML